MSENARDIPVVKLFTYNKEYYCYDTYSNILMRVTKGIYSEICKLKRIGITEYKSLCLTCSDYKDVLVLLEKGLLQYNFIKEIIHPESMYIDRLIERCVSQLILEVTSACNFRCRYCHQPRKSDNHSKMMDVNTAHRSIDFLFEHSKDATEIAITFYGGEPLLNFELIKSVVSYANRRFKFKPIFYNMTTNASLLNHSIISFLVENRFSLLISLDGNEDTQNYHRKYYSDGGATFNVVWNNVLYIREKYPEYFDMYVRFNAVALPDESTEAVISFFENNNISKASITISDADLSGIDYRVTKLHLDNREQNYISFEKNYKELINRLESKDKLPSKWHHSGPCVPAARRLFISTEGDFYPCEKVEGARDCLLGNLNIGVNAKKARELLNVGSLTSEDCKQCWAMRFCSICVRQCLDGDCISLQKKKIACKQSQKHTMLLLREYIKTRKCRIG